MKKIIYRGKFKISFGGLKSVLNCDGEIAIDQQPPINRPLLEVDFSSVAESVDVDFLLSNCAEQIISELNINFGKVIKFDGVICSIEVGIGQYDSSREKCYHRVDLNIQSSGKFEVFDLEQTSEPTNLQTAH